jgi:hypothetical protein
MASYFRQDDGDKNVDPYKKLAGIYRLDMAAFEKASLYHKKRIITEAMAKQLQKTFKHDDPEGIEAQEVSRRIVFGTDREELVEM